MTAQIEPFTATIAVRDLRMLSTLHVYQGLDRNAYTPDVLLQPCPDTGSESMLRATFQGVDGTVLRVDVPVAQVSGAAMHYDQFSIKDALGSLSATKGSATITDDILSYNCGLSAHIQKQSVFVSTPVFELTGEPVVAVLPANVFFESLEHGFRAMVKDSTRPVLQTVRIIGDEERQEIRIQSTDGFRAYLPVLPAIMVSDFDIKVPPGAVKTALQAFRDRSGDVDIRVASLTPGSKSIQLATGRVRLEAAESEKGNYPNMEQVDPRARSSVWQHKMPNRITAKRADLIAACKMVLADKTNCMLMESKNGSVSVSWKRDDAPGTTIGVDVPCMLFGDDGLPESSDRIAFDAQYLKDALEACQDDTPTIYCSVNFGPSIIGDTILMPMQLPK